MASRRDQLHSYQFLLQRVISALVMRETDPAQAPLRRGVGAVFAGVMIAVIVAAGFGVYGIFTGVGSNNWQADGSVVIEKETGASFLYQGGVLHPMLNYSSALLASGKPAPATFRVAAQKLVGVPRGDELGIPNAPDSLPAATDLVNGPWTLCSEPQRDVSGNSTTTTALVVGELPSGGTQLSSDGLLVNDPTTSSTYLIWNAHHYLIQSPGTVAPALFGAQTTPVPVGTAWLNGLDKGQDIAPVPIPGGDKGKPVGGTSGHSVGDIVYDETGQGKQYYLVLSDGLAPLSQLETLVQETQAPQPSQVAANVISSAPKSTQPVNPQSDGATLAPRTPPSLIDVPGGDQASVCTASRGSGDSPTVLVGPDMASVGQGIATGSVSGSGTTLADRVVVPPGKGALVMSTASGQATSGAYDVVTDLGQRYPVSSSAALGSLGYSASQAVAMSASLVTRIPEGPTLDQAAALRSVPSATH